MAGKALQRSQPLPSGYEWRDEKMHMVGHHYKRMQSVESKTLAVEESPNDQIRHFRLAQECPSRLLSSNLSIARNARPFLNRSGGKTRFAGRLPWRRKVTNSAFPTMSWCGSRRS